MTIRIIVADDHPLVRDGVRFRIENRDSELEVIGEAKDGQALLALAESTPADVYLVDVTMPILNGLEATRELLKRRPESRVIILSFHVSGPVVRKALAAGARGYVTKESASRCIIEAILAVFQGQFYLSPDVTAAVVQPLVDGPLTASDSRPLPNLTSAQVQVVQLVAEGHSTREIATLLAISVNTVKKHRANAMSKLGIHDQISLARYALREGIAKP